MIEQLICDLALDKSHCPDGGLDARPAQVVAVSTVPEEFGIMARKAYEPFHGLRPLLAS